MMLEMVSLRASRHCRNLRGGRGTVSGPAAPWCVHVCLPGPGPPAPVCVSVPTLPPPPRPGPPARGCPESPPPRSGSPGPPGVAVAVGDGVQAVVADAVVELQRRDLRRAPVVLSAAPVGAAEETCGQRR